MSKSNDDPTRLHRRAFLGKLAVAGLSAPFLSGALAQMNHEHNHGNSGASTPMGHGSMGHSMGGMGMGMQSSSIGPDVLAPSPIPWATGTCEFCGMTIATPTGGAMAPGFRERTYGQIRVVDPAVLAGRSEVHFESLACMVNYAYARGIRDGHGATFYVADEGAGTTPDHGLLLARDATFLWAEGLQVSMAAKFAAYPNEAAAQSALERIAMPGRSYMLSASMVYDLAPIPEMNLVPLLVRAMESGS